MSFLALITNYTLLSSISSVFPYSKFIFKTCICSPLRCTYPFRKHRWVTLLVAWWRRSGSYFFQLLDKRAMFPTEEHFFNWTTNRTKRWQKQARALLRKAAAAGTRYNAEVGLQAFYCFLVNDWAKEGKKDERFVSIKQYINHVNANRNIRNPNIYRMWSIYSERLGAGNAMKN